MCPAPTESSTVSRLQAAVAQLQLVRESIPDSNASAHGRLVQTVEALEVMAIEAADDRSREQDSTSEGPHLNRGQTSTPASVQLPDDVPR